MEVRVLHNNLFHGPVLEEVTSSPEFLNAAASAGTLGLLGKIINYKHFFSACDHGAVT